MDMDEPTSRIEQLLIQLAEWRVRFLHERQWRESVEKDKKALEEKYSQVVFELGTQKRAIEDLEARVVLLSATTGPQAGAGEGRVSGEDFGEQSEVKVEAAGSDRESEPESARVADAAEGAGHEHGMSAGHRHHIYSNPAVYESSVAWVHGRHHGKRRELHIEEEPYIFHRYRPDEGVGHHAASQRHVAAELNTVLDNEIASLENNPSKADQGV